MPRIQDEVVLSGGKRGGDLKDGGWHLAGPLRPHPLENWAS